MKLCNIHTFIVRVCTCLLGAYLLVSIQKSLWRLMFGRPFISCCDPSRDLSCEYATFNVYFTSCMKVRYCDPNIGPAKAKLRVRESFAKATLRKKCEELLFPDTSMSINPHITCMYCVCVCVRVCVCESPAMLLCVMQVRILTSGWSSVINKQGASAWHHDTSQRS